jgi:hypothetical protein
MRRIHLLIGAGVIIAAAVVLIVVAVAGGGDDKKKAALEDPLPESKDFHTGADASPYGGPTPLKIKFMAEPFLNKGTVTYYWNFNDGTTTREQNPTHSFPEAGYYQVRMNAIDTETKKNDSKNLIIGAWPPKVWAAGLQRKININKEVRKQRARTEARLRKLRQAKRAETG